MSDFAVICALGHFPLCHVDYREQRVQKTWNMSLKAMTDHFALNVALAG